MPSRLMSGGSEGRSARTSAIAVVQAVGGLVKPEGIAERHAERADHGDRHWRGPRPAMSGAEP